MHKKTKILLMKAILKRLEIGREKIMNYYTYKNHYKDVYGPKMPKEWVNNQENFYEIFDNICEDSDPELQNFISRIDSYGSLKIIYNGYIYKYLNVYKQEDNWTNWFDVCLLRGRKINLGLYEPDGITFYEGELPKEIQSRHLVIDKRAYSFHKRSKEIHLRITETGFKKLPRELSIPSTRETSESLSIILGGPWVKFKLKKISKKDEI